MVKHAQTIRQKIAFICSALVTIVRQKNLKIIILFKIIHEKSQSLIFKACNFIKK